MLETTIGQLTEFLHSNPSLINDVEIETRFGFYDINAIGITAYNSDVYKIQTRCGKVIKGSPDHLLLSNNLKWVKLKELEIGSILFTKDGVTTVSKKRLLKVKQDLYDIEVDKVSEFYANEIVSHNSSMLDVTCFALFGKPYRKINKPQLINSITKKNLLVELEFEVDYDSYLIRRGMKPSIFEIFKNGVLLNQPGDSKDYQSILENQILKQTFKTFTQISILGSARYTAFMELTTAQRREVIEDLLDLQIFSSMNLVCKTKISENQEEIRNEEYNLSGLNTKLDVYRKSKQDTADFYQREIELKEVDRKALKERILSKHTLFKESELEFNSLVKPAAIEALRIEERQEIQELGSLKAEAQMLEKQEQFFKTSKTCSLCLQEIGKHHKHQNTENLQKTLKINKENQRVIEGKIRKTRKLIEDMEMLQNQYSEKEYVLREQKNNLAILKKQYQTLESDIKSLKRKQAETTVKNIEDENLIQIDIQNSNKILEDLKKTKQYLQVILNSLKDTGVKASIISEYIPLLNQRINYYLEKMNFMVSFELSENFEETIKSRHRDIFSYGSFSEGQKNRINICLLLAFRDIAKARNSVSTNLLVMDEILDTSLDDSGIDDLMFLLDTMKNSNIIVISHKSDNISDRFDRILQFKLRKNFTEMDVF